MQHDSWRAQLRDAERERHLSRDARTNAPLPREVSQPRPCLARAAACRQRMHGIVNMQGCCELGGRAGGQEPGRAHSPFPPCEPLRDPKKSSLKIDRGLNLSQSIVLVGHRPPARPGAASGARPLRRVVTFLSLLSRALRRLALPSGGPSLRPIARARLPLAPRRARLCRWKCRSSGWGAGAGPRQQAECSL
eukprot:366064-Chlamydomonas_euryale.AAC.4